MSPMTVVKLGNILQYNLLDIVKLSQIELISASGSHFEYRTINESQIYALTIFVLICLIRQYPASGIKRHSSIKPHLSNNIWDYIHK